MNSLKLFSLILVHLLNYIFNFIVELIMFWLSINNDYRIYSRLFRLLEFTLFQWRIKSNFKLVPPLLHCNSIPTRH